MPTIEKRSNFSNENSDQLQTILGSATSRDINSSKPFNQSIMITYVGTYFDFLVIDNCITYGRGHSNRAAAVHTADPLRVIKITNGKNSISGFNFFLNRVLLL